MRWYQSGLCGKCEAHGLVYMNDSGGFTDAYSHASAMVRDGDVKEVEQRELTDAIKRVYDESWDERARCAEDYDA